MKMTPEKTGTLWTRAYLLGFCCRFEESHALEVVRLSTMLFDALRPLHAFGEKEKRWLQCAALLHDIGWIWGRKNHHKSSMEIILAAPFLTNGKYEAVIIGLIARYHRKALPNQKHRYFNQLRADDRHMVMQLASMLRLADGLDYAHQNIVKTLCGTLKKDVFQLSVQVARSKSIQLSEILKKTDLFEAAFGKKITVTKK